MTKKIKAPLTEDQLQTAIENSKRIEEVIDIVEALRKSGKRDINYFQQFFLRAEHLV